MMVFGGWGADWPFPDNWISWLNKSILFAKMSLKTVYCVLSQSI